MTQVLSELPALKEKDCFHVVERFKSEFTFPLHHHREMELNFIENGAGLRRVVGDSAEIVGDYDLVLIAGKDLVHTWEQNDTPPKKMHEITIQFSPDLLMNLIETKKQFASIGEMFKKAERGLAFPVSSIMKVYSQIMQVLDINDDFNQLLALLRLLHSLSLLESRELSSRSFSHVDIESENKRIAAVKLYVQENFRSQVSLVEASALVSMSPTTLSHFFKQSTGRTLTEYIIEYRLGHAARLLLDTSMTISEICFDSGFNNIANFGRLFKKKHGMTPKEFRHLYKKNKYVL